MTDKERRVADPGFHDEHQQILESLGEVKQALEFHIGSTHALTKFEAQGIADETAVTVDLRQVVSENDRLEIHRQLDDIAEVVLGVRHKNVDGMITRSGGMAAMVKANENGGLRFKYTNLIVTTLGIVLVALFGLFGTIVQHQSSNTQVNDAIVKQVEDNTGKLGVIIGELEQLESVTVP